MKVYSVNSFRGARQVRLVVATTSKAEAARLVNVSRTYMQDYGSVTGNAQEIALATSAPGRLFWREIDGTEWTGPC